MIVRVCDRCGVHISSGCLLDSGGRFVVSLDVSEYDLCEPCFDATSDFLNTEPAKEEKP